MNNNFDLVVIYRRMEKKDVINYIPVYCEVGTYNQESEVFTTTKGKKYRHMIEGEEYAFLGRLPLSRYTDLYPKSSLFTIKTKAFINNAKHRYILSESKDNVPIVLQVEKNDKYNIFLDSDLINYYKKYYPELEINNIIDIDNDGMNIRGVYKELTSKIIGQDEQIKQILSTIWKQLENDDKVFNYNMLINGPEGVGKTTIFKLLEDLLGIPCVIINAKRLNNISYIENTLLKLMEKTDYNLELAEKGILVIDKLEEISTNSRERHSTLSKEYQEIIISLIDEGLFTINNIDNKRYRFNMDKLLIVGLGNFNNDKHLRNTTVGFSTDSKESTLDSYGIIPKLANKFPILIEMNNLTLEDYINIIKNSTLSSLNTNREFLGKKNINLEISEEVINMIARIAYDRKLGAKSINEILESSLALAEFEIASNPSLYESLIIDKTTIKDNKKYTLVKRKND